MSAMSGLPSSANVTPARSGELLAAVTETIVRMHRDYHGRGPTLARTSWVGANGLMCVMRDCLTRGERTLAAQGRGERVRDGREALHRVTAPHVCSAVGKPVGREVVAVLATVSLEPEVAVHFFMLGPQRAVARNEDRAAG
jgi:uncharacterized protein YbcI